jgi:hypothetical protein
MMIASSEFVVLVRKINDKALTESVEIQGS